MERIRADKYIPDWNGVYKRYAQKLINKDLWKYQNLGYEKSDLLQEAWVSFDFCVKRYTTKEPRHFMSLFKKRLHCQLWYLSQASSKGNFIVHDTYDEQNYDGVVNNKLLAKGKLDYNTGPLNILLERAPAEIKEVLNALVNAPSDLVDELFLKKRITNTDICRVIGYDPKKSLCKALGYKDAEMKKMNLLEIFREYFGCLQKR
jgi:hypothetical protein